MSDTALKGLRSTREDWREAATLMPQSRKCRMLREQWRAPALRVGGPCLSSAHLLGLLTLTQPQCACLWLWSPGSKGNVIICNHLPKPDAAFNKSCEHLNSFFLSDLEISRKNRKKQLTFLNPKVTEKFGSDTFWVGFKLEIENPIQGWRNGPLASCTWKPVPQQNLLWENICPEQRRQEARAKSEMGNKTTLRPCTMKHKVTCYSFLGDRW